MKCPKCQNENPGDTLYCGKCGIQLPSLKEVSAPTETIEALKEELTTGSTFADRYQIIEELGKGGMGKVYKVLDTKIKEKIALKLLKPEIASDKNTIERFSNELKFSRKIRHENVCQMYDINEEKGTHYITMEYIHGEDLKRLIRKMGQMSAGQAISLAKQMCEGLAEAHKLGTVHRDLKPQNIMVDEEGKARIMDFGIARSLKGKGMTGAGVMIGTPEYMSPEQVEGKDVDQRSDIYSLGVILYEMVTGRVPFEGDTPFTIGVKQKSEIPREPGELNSQVPSNLSSVIMKCLEKDKDKRYQSAGEVRQELISIEKGIPTTERIIPERKPITSREITVTFGVKKLFIPALVVAAVITAAVVIWKVLPQKEAVFAPKIENSIAVVSFENQTGDEAYDYLQKAIPNLLITSLEQTGQVYVVTWERMSDLLEQMGKKDTETIGKNLGFKLCRMEGVESIILGSFIKAENMFATDIKVLDVETKKLLKSASSKGMGVDSILKTQIDELSKEITEGIGLARERIEPVKAPIIDATTSSMEAYKYFLQGTDMIRKFYFEDAIGFLEKAVELDPDFATAYGYLAGSYSWIGNIGARDEAIKKAKALSQKTTDKERFFIEARYAGFIERDREKRIGIIQQAAEKYPKEKLFHGWLGALYRYDGKYDKALEEYNKVLELDPNYGEVHNELGYLYVYMKNFKKSLEHFKKYASLNPGDANPLDSTAEAYFLMGRLDEAIAKYKEALEIKPDWLGTFLKIGYIYALKEDYPEAMKWVDKDIAIATAPGTKREGYMYKGFHHFWLGNLEKSLIDLQKAVDLAVAAGSITGKAFGEWFKGWIYYDRGEYELSRQHNENWLDVFMKYYPQKASSFKSQYSFLLGLIELGEGHIDSAKTGLAELNSLFSELLPGDKEGATFRASFLQAEIMLAEGSYEKAVVIFEKASPPTPPTLQNTSQIIGYNTPFLKDVIARAYKQAGNLDKAIAEYERLITFDPKSKGRFLIHPRYHYRLARLYEEKGWKGKAIDQYEKFLDLLKNANPGILEVEEAKKRLAALK
ncbi:hypothetical protein LCGC14_0689650 [marine sediment metagenome]|uniref:Protein kinase domain-containing protein n=1 Tax=marine sediment metagenome TaxID=412755 RepID=A0A0F9R687_9ZZZZ